jgi:hypothetical protein
LRREAWGRWLGVTLALGAALVLGPADVESGSGSAPEQAVVGRIRMSPLLVDLDIDPSVARVGDRITVRAEISNVGPEAVGRVVTRLRFDPS